MAKATLTEERRQELMIATREMAHVVADDLDYVRSVAQMKVPRSGDIRRMSGILRRLLVYQELKHVAEPRVGRLFIESPDLKTVYHSNDSEPFDFVCCDNASIFDLGIALIPSDNRLIKGYGPDLTTKLNVDQFQAQRVIWFKEHWITRVDLVKFFANIAGGVHTDTPKTSVELLIRRARGFFRIKKLDVVNEGDPTASLDFNNKALSPVEPDIEIEAGKIDLPLLYLLSTAQWLTSAPDVLLLESKIRECG